MSRLHHRSAGTLASQIAGAAFFDEQQRERVRALLGSSARPADVRAFLLRRSPRGRGAARGIGGLIVSDVEVYYGNDLPTGVWYNAATDALDGHTVDKYAALDAVHAAAVTHPLTVTDNNDRAANTVALQAMIDSITMGGAVIGVPNAAKFGTIRLSPLGPFFGQHSAIRPMDVSMIPTGRRRIARATAAQLPEFMCGLEGDTGSGPAIGIQLGASNWIVYGVHVPHNPASNINYGLIAFNNNRGNGAGQVSHAVDRANFPHDFAVGKSIVLGEVTNTLQYIRGAYVAADDVLFDGCVIDEFLGGSNSDPQAISFARGARFECNNTLLGAGGENIMLGAGTSLQDAREQCVDGFVRRCELRRVQGWVQTYSAKTIYEIKNCLRSALTDSSIHDSGGVQAHLGQGFTFKSVGHCVDTSFGKMGSTHITVHRNEWSDMGCWGSFAHYQDEYTGAPTINEEWVGGVVLTQNYAHHIGAADSRHVPGSGVSGNYLLRHTRDIENLVIARNTALCNTSDTTATQPVWIIWAGAHTAPRATVRAAMASPERILNNVINSIVAHEDSVGATHFLWSAGVPNVPHYVATLDRATIAGNMWCYGTAGHWALRSSAAEGVQVNGFASAGFVDLAAKDFRLATGSPGKGMATDGGDPGCDIDVGSPLWARARSGNWVD